MQGKTIFYRQTDRQTDRYNIISLGSFCSVAMELERVGIRNGSFPFDWLISGNFHSVLSMIENHFEGFTNKENLYQEFNICPAYYFNKVCDVHFYHDFSPYKSFDQQYDTFKAKYLRRIDRFYKTIETPTIFVRYCTSQAELEYVFENQQYIRSFFKTFNPSNEIIYVANTDKQFQIENIYYVEKDPMDSVARMFFEKAPELREYLVKCSIVRENMINNIKRYNKNKSRKIIRKIITKIKKFLHIKAYYHYQQYEELLIKKDECKT